MTTINTIEDLLKLLDENPQWVEALRERLLSRELIELPEMLAQFAAEMREFAASANARFDRLEANVEQLMEESAQTRANVAQLTEESAQTRANVAQLTEESAQTRANVAQLMEESAQTRTDVEQLKERGDRHQASIDQLQRDVQGIRNDLGPIKGAYARNTAHREAVLIAEEFGFSLVRIVGFEELVSFTRGSNADGIPANHIRSFHRADLIMEVQDGDGKDCYLAVEVSYTVDERDSVRAIRNARFLTRFTQRPAYAVAAGLRYDERVQPSMESRELLWYELDVDDLEAE